jgi:hypothetical protein
MPSKFVITLHTGVEVTWWIEGPYLAMLVLFIFHDSILFYFVINTFEYNGIICRINFYPIYILFAKYIPYRLKVSP